MRDSRDVTQPTLEALEPRLLLNAAPEIVSLELSAGAIDENGSVTLTTTFTDEDLGDTHFADIDWGDGTAVQTVFFAMGKRDFSRDHTYLDDPAGSAADPYTISVTVNDGTDTDTDTVDVTVDNVAPAITDLSLDSPAIDENGTANLTIDFDDPGTLDEHTIEIDWGDGNDKTVVLPVGDRSFTTGHQYLDDGSGGAGSVDYTISVSVTDDDTGSDSDSTIVTVSNVEPTITALALDFSVIDENSSVNLSVDFTDPGTLDEHTVEIDWGDGSTVDVFTLTVGERSFQADHQYLDDDPSGTPSDDYQIAVTVSDDDGGSDSASTTVTVNNVDPAIGELILDSLVIDENDTATLTGSFTDPGTLDEHTIEIDWGDGSAVDVFTLIVGERSFQAAHQYLDDDPSGTPSDDYVITVTVIDDDTGQDTDQTTITVNNVPPVIQEIFSSAPGVGDAAEGEEVTVWGSFTDVGTLDTHTAEVDWDDGTTSPAVIDETGGSGTFTATHVYEFGGIYTVTVTLVDDDTGTDTAMVMAVITGAGVNDGVLQIVGTEGRDWAKVNQRGNGLLMVHATFLSGRKRHRTFDSEGVERIEILLGDGHDRAQISGNIDLPTIVDGGAGHDFIKAGRGPSVLLGEEGNDMLIGGQGNDVLIGGEGRDRLVGLPGDDILIGGTTLFDIHDDQLPLTWNEPLLAILAEWSSQRDFETRVANLSGTGTGDRLNDDYFLQEDVTVLDDGQVDRLTGSSGQVWIFEALDARTLRWMQRWQELQARRAAWILKRKLWIQARRTGESFADLLAQQPPPPVGLIIGNPVSTGNGNSGQGNNAQGDNGNADAPQAKNGQSNDSPGNKGQGNSGQGTNGQDDHGQSNDAQGSDAQGSDAQGSDAQGSDTQGSDTQGTDTQGSDTQGSDDQDNKGQGNKGQGNSDHDNNGRGPNK